MRPTIGASRTSASGPKLVNQPLGQALPGKVGVEHADVVLPAARQRDGHGIADVAGEERDPRVGHVLVEPVR